MLLVVRVDELLELELLVDCVELLLEDELLELLEVDIVLEDEVEIVLLDVDSDVDKLELELLVD